MAGVPEEIVHEIELVEQEENGSSEEVEEENGAHDRSAKENTTFLSNLNLLVTLLSLVSVPSDNCLDSEKTEIERSNEHYEAKAYIARFHARRQDSHEVKFIEKRSQRFHQHTIKDCRHGRRMGKRVNAQDR